MRAGVAVGLGATFGHDKDGDEDLDPDVEAASDDVDDMATGS